MSLHYEWTLSLRLRPDVPDSFLHELRFHLGHTEQPPERRELDIDEPCLTMEPQDVLPGGPAGSLLVQHPYLNEPGSYGLFVRLLLLDDQMYDRVTGIPSWLARWSRTQGWIGYAREESALQPWMNFYVQNGHAYAAGPGETPAPLREPAPPFTLRDTSDLG